MGLRLDKAWRPLDAETAAGLRGQLGVYQIADAGGAVLYIGFAGGRSLFGLRGVLGDEASAPRPDAAQFRVEITMQYMSRHAELLMLHVADHGELPPENRNDPPRRLGRLSPA